MLEFLDGYKTYIGFCMSGVILIAASAGWIDWHTAGVLGGVAGAWTGVSLRMAIDKVHAAAEFAAGLPADQHELVRIAASKAQPAAYSGTATTGYLQTDSKGSTQNGVQQSPLSERAESPQ